MRILMLTPYLPYPPSSGGQIRTYNLLKYLSKNHKITLISLYKQEREKKYVKHLEKYCSQIFACKRAEKPWQLKNILKAVFSRKPFLIVRNFSEEASKVSKKLLINNKFDVIHAETFYIMPHLPETKVPILLVEQTIEYRVYQHFVRKLFFLFRWLFYIDIVKLKYWERFYWKKANLVATVSELDREKIKELEPGVALTVIPNGAGDEIMNIPLTKKNLKQPTLLFVGNFYWLQNVEAAKILIEDIYPRLKKRMKNFRLIIAGQNAQNKLKQKSKANLKVIDIEAGDINTACNLYETSTLFIAPIYGPGGTRLKILAAMAAGLPIISTSTGVDGLGLKVGSEVLIAETVDEFVTQIENIINDKKLYQQIQKNVYKLVRVKYSWSKIAHQLEEEYRKLKKQI